MEVAGVEYAEDYWPLPVARNVYPALLNFAMLPGAAAVDLFQETVAPALR